MEGGEPGVAAAARTTATRPRCGCARSGARSAGCSNARGCPRPGCRPHERERCGRYVGGRRSGDSNGRTPGCAAGCSRRMPSPSARRSAAGARRTRPRRGRRSRRSSTTSPGRWASHRRAKPSASVARRTTAAGRGGADRRVRVLPRRELSAAERKDVFDVLCSERFVDRSPAEVFATLLDEGVYLCSERTMYRVLAENRAVIPTTRSPRWRPGDPTRPGRGTSPGSPEPRRGPSITCTSSSTSTAATSSVGWSPRSPPPSANACCARDDRSPSTGSPSRAGATPRRPRRRSLLLPAPRLERQPLPNPNSRPSRPPRLPRLVRLHR